MKKEVTVCDLADEHSDACKRLADFVCPICRRDVCLEHRTPRLNVHIRIVWPNRPQMGGQPPRDEEAGARNEFLYVCVGCFRSASVAPTHMVHALMGKTMQDAIEAYAADFAASQLNHGKPDVDD